MNNPEFKQQLAACKDRPTGLQLIQKLTTAELHAFAKFIGVSATAKYQLQTRVVERVVGLRLRQEAIASLDLSN
jgi:hypothetical protein